ncbi:hypothetical protein RYX36_021401, partial [Vicia faba]
HNGVVKIEHEPRNLMLDSNDTATHSGIICCNCSELLKNLHCIVKELQYNKGEQMKMKLQNERKTSKIFKTLFLFSWIIVIAYFKMSD